MAQGTPVVTSAGTATEEAAGGAAILVDPLDVDDIAAGLDTAHEQAAALVRGGTPSGSARRRGRRLRTPRWRRTTEACGVVTRVGVARGGDSWEALARENPLWGVLSHDAYLDASASSIPEDFWTSGELHVARVLDTIRRQFDPSFSPRSVLDFGCGVGRLLRPFAGEADEVVGVDVSSTMRSLAMATLREQGIEHGRVVATTGELVEQRCSFDLVHSVLVFQHLRRHVR